MSNKTKAAGAVVAALLASAGVAGALNVPPTVVEGEPGTTHLLATEPTPPGDLGKECGITITTTNNESTRSGTDIIVRSDSELILPNVEAAPGTRAFKGTIILGPNLTISVRLGPEGAYSGSAMTSNLICPQVGPPISSPPAPPVKAPPPFTG